jgi:hypothetical protein
MSKKKELCPVETFRWFQNMFNFKVRHDVVFKMLPNDMKADKILEMFYEDFNEKEYKKNTIRNVLFPVFSLFIKRNKLYLSYE